MTEAQHHEPAWIDRADFVLQIAIEDPEYAKTYSNEQLAARELGGGTYELCCIPFFVYDLFLGDIVSVDERFYVNKIVERSKRKGFRVATKNRSDQDYVISQMQNYRLLYERFSDQLLAIDVPDEKTNSKVADQLQVLEDTERVLEYENIARSHY